MKVAAYARQETEDHQAVARAIVKGALGQGEDAWMFGKADPQRQENADVVTIFGIGGDARQIWDANEGKRRILLDKPYARGRGRPGATRYSFVRVAVDGFQPLPYFQRKPRPPDRWVALGMDVRPYRIKEGPILFDGASNKYCLWNDLPPWQEWGQQMVNQIAAHTTKPILYRPRPSHNEPPTCYGARLSQAPLAEDLHQASVVVSHGGNIGFDAAVAGVPHFAIADSAARPISETRWTHVSQPRVPTPRDRAQWFYDLAYCQWHLDEFVDGQAWRYVRECLDQIDLNAHLASKYPKG